MNRAEQQVHIAIVDFLRYALGQTWLVVHVPNEGLRSRIAGGKLREMGMLAGFPDIMVVGPPMRYAARAEADGAIPVLVCHFVGFLEVKTDKGKLTPAQEAFRDECRRSRRPWALCRSIDDAREALREWGVKTKEEK
jgi:hypothetical protein